MAQEVFVEAGGQRVSLTKVDASAMRSALSELKLGTAGTTEALAARLLEHYGAAAAADDLSYCDACGTGSVVDDDGDPCPFCGAADADEDGDDDDVVEQASKENKVSMTSKNDVVAAAALRPLVKVSPRKAAVVVPTTVVPTTEKELDKAVGRVRSAMADAQSCAWKLGCELKAIFDAELWMMRVGADGKPAYKTFDAFVRAEFEMARQQAFNYIRAAQNFTKEEVAEIGIAKASLLLGAPEKARAGLKKNAKRQTKQQVAKDVKKARETAPKAEAPGKKRGRKAQVTVITVGDKHMVNLFAAPKNAEEKKKPVRAKKLSDQPWGRHVHDNGVAMYFRLRETPGGLQVVIQTKRVEDDE